jgi:hypothetical protein
MDIHTSTYRERGRERERERERERCMDGYGYIYTHRERERERERLVIVIVINVSHDARTYTDFAPLVVPAVVDELARVPKPAVACARKGLWWGACFLFLILVLVCDEGQWAGWGGVGWGGVYTYGGCNMHACMHAWGR